jgi:alpha-L-fucosidase
MAPNDTHTIDARMTYRPTFESIAAHRVPAWYEDAKLGIFVHWGLYSVPGWAPNGAGIDEQVASAGWESMLANNPYAEWYQNSLRLGDTPTRRHHLETYGRGFAYDDFAPMFRQAAARFDPGRWATLFEKVGARYMVFTTKHHDGFLMWPSPDTSPRKPGRFASERDIVADVAEAARAHHLRVGLYYSGGLDWTFNEQPVRSYMDAYATIVQDPAFVSYATKHWHELIDRHAPSILWNDIGSPRAFDVAGLVAAYYNAVPDGLVNDRWSQRLPDHAPGPGETINPPPARHYDYTTPEYASYAQITERKWEATRGIGHSFGYNANEGPEDYLSTAELVLTLVDIVSKNGNLLLNVGPMADGTIPDLQRDRLLGLGAWLDVNGEAIFETRPWLSAEGRCDDGTQVRFTQREDALYAIILGTPATRDVVLEGLLAADGTEVRLLGQPDPLIHGQAVDGLQVTLPGGLTDAAAHALKVTPKPRQLGV